MSSLRIEGAELYSIYKNWHGEILRTASTRARLSFSSWITISSSFQGEQRSADSERAKICTSLDHVHFYVQNVAHVSSLYTNGHAEMSSSQSLAV